MELIVVDAQEANGMDFLELYYTIHVFGIFSISEHRPSVCVLPHYN